MPFFWDVQGSLSSLQILVAFVNALKNNEIIINTSCLAVHENVGWLMHVLLVDVI